LLYIITTKFILYLLYKEVLQIKYNKAELASSIDTRQLVKSKDNDSDYFRKLESKNIFLNENQLKFCRHIKGAAVVDSVAGSGKSTSVASRIGRMIEVENIDPSNILLITYTKKGAIEMIEKTAQITGLPQSKLDKITKGTFHAVFLGILRELGYNQEIWSSNKSKEIAIKGIMRKTKIFGLDWSEVTSWISLQKNKGISVEQFKGTNARLINLHIIWRELEKHKAENNLIEFDDMLLILYKELQTNKELLSKLQDKFQHIIIDEYQDTNWIQSQVIYMIAQHHQNVVVVGDLDQCIFTFAGARLENILRFEEMYPDAVRYQLDVNYRSNNAILGLANSVINDNVERIKKTAKSIYNVNHYPKFIFPESSYEEAQYIAKQIQQKVENKEAKYSDFAILYRNKSNSRAIVDEFLLSGIPFIQYGESENFYENQYIAPILSYMRVIVKPNDFKAIETMLPMWYISKDNGKKIKAKNNFTPISEPLEHLYSLFENDPTKIDSIRKNISQLKQYRNGQYKPLVLVKQMRQQYEKYLIDDKGNNINTLHKEIIRETLDELENSLKRFPTISEFIEYVDKILQNAEVQKRLQKNPNYDGVKLMTIHKSKGLEFNYVFLISMIEGIMPFFKEDDNLADITVRDFFRLLEEERRLLYVAITRARAYLTLSCPRSHKGKVALPSRFLQNYI